MKTHNKKIKENPEASGPAEEKLKDSKKTDDKKSCSKAQNELDEAKDRIKELEDSLKSEKDSYLRLMAEFETFRRRSAEERLALVGSASSETIEGLLPVLDDCERALELLKDSSDEAAKTGTRLIYDKLMAYLKSKGLEVIPSNGEPFNTDFHEAVAQLPAADEKAKGLVFDTVQTGYTLKGKILRFAKVVVNV